MFRGVGIIWGYVEEVFVEEVFKSHVLVSSIRINTAMCVIFLYP